MNNENVKYFLGADPEYFVFFRPEGMSPTPVAAHIADIPYTAERASGTDRLDQYRHQFGWTGSYFRDGVALELNPSFSYCRQVLIHNMRGLLTHLTEKLAAKGFYLSPQAALHFPMDQITSGPSDVKRWGCNPTLSAYDPGVPKVPPVAALETDIRTTGGHIHITATKEREECVLNMPEHYPTLVRLMDLYVGVPFTYLLGHQIGNSLRRTLYGVAGEYREVKVEGYGGIEYRVLPASMWNTAWMASLALGSVREVVRRYEELVPTLASVSEADVQRAINKCDAPLCADLTQTLPGFYSIDTLRRIRNMVPLSLRLHRENWQVNDAGWGGFLKDHGVEPPSTGARFAYNPNSSMDPSAA